MYVLYHYFTGRGEYDIDHRYDGCPEQDGAEEEHAHDSQLLPGKHVGSQGDTDAGEAGTLAKEPGHLRAGAAQPGKGGDVRSGRTPGIESPVPGRVRGE